MEKSFLFQLFIRIKHGYATAATLLVFCTIHSHATQDRAYSSTVKRLSKLDDWFINFSKVCEILPIFHSNENVFFVVVVLNDAPLLLLKALSFLVLSLNKYTVPEDQRDTHTHTELSHLYIWVVWTQFSSNQLIMLFNEDISFVQ